MSDKSVLLIMMIKTRKYTLEAKQYLFLKENSNNNVRAGIASKCYVEVICKSTCKI